MMSKFNKIHNAILDKKIILGVGPMSFNCVDATIEVANDRDIPIKLISSRRQVEHTSLGGGYVTDTKTLAKYVKERDKKSNVFLARDHGGPWQGTDEELLSDEDATSAAKLSFLGDIESGFDILHVDPSIKSRPLYQIIEDVKTYHNHCEYHAKRLNKHIIYEIGTEEHSGHTTKIEEFKNFAIKFSRLNNVKFIVGNVGMYVKETKNIGKLQYEKAKKLVEICNENNLYLKGHNSDYITEDDSQKYLQAGVHSVNIAPEFGTRETEKLLSIFQFYKMNKEHNKFIELAVESKKWTKWMEVGSKNQSNLHKAIICGHYLFSDPRVVDLKKQLKRKCPNLDTILKDTVKNSIESYLKRLGWKL